MKDTAVRSRATVVIPTYNEAENLEPLVRRICAALPEVEIVVVDDASQDGTAERGRALAGAFPVRVVERVGERGLSTAVLRGLREARTDICVVMDADLSHPPERIPALVQAVEEGAEVAVGSRYVAGGDIDEWPLFRRFASKAGTLLARPLTPVRDPMAGFFCLRRSLLEGADLKPRGFKILLEILARAKPKRVLEVPIRFEDRAAGASKFDSRERREFLKQAWTLYRDLNAWPWRVAKFLATGASGYVVHIAVLCAAVELLGASPYLGAVFGFAVAMTSNYCLNRLWTFRAQGVPVASSYAIYALGAVGGLGVQIGVMKTLAWMHYVPSATLGIVAGTVFTFLTSQLAAFGGAAGRLPRWAAVVVVMTLLRLAFAATVPLTPEEAYHWNWSRHLDWCYYDHPPMVAWGIALGRLLFGDSEFGVRFVPILFAAGTAAVLARMARRLYGERAAVWAVLLFTIQPLTFLASGSGFPDSPLLFFWALAMSLVGKALETGRGAWWLGAGAALGATGLSKYTGVFLGVSVLLYLLLSPRDRRWLATPWPYLASALALGVLAPVFTWNAAHHWTSFRFQGVERIQQGHPFTLLGPLKYVGQQSLAVLPLTLPLAIAALARGARSPRPEERYLFWVFVPMVVFFFGIATVRVVHLMWPLPAYLGLTVAMAGAMVGAEGWVARLYERRRAWLLGLSAAGLAGAALHTVYFLPGLSPMQGLYGWKAAAERAREVRAGMPPGTFYLGVGRKYTCPSQLAFRLRAPYEVHGRNLLGDMGSQYDFWVDARRLEGRDAVVVVEDAERLEGTLPALRRCFAGVEPAGVVIVPVGRAPVLPTPPLQFAFFRARGYRPPPEALKGPVGARGD